MGSPGDGRGNAKAARVAEGVQNGRAICQLRNAGAMFALIKEPTGLLPTQRINGEGKPAFLNGNHACFAMQELGFLGQAFQRAHRAVIARNYHAGRDQGVQCFQDQRCRGFHAGTIGLDGHRIAVAINHQTRQAICFGMDQSVMWAVEQLVAQRQRFLQALLEPGQVASGIVVTVQLTRANQ